MKKLLIVEDDAALRNGICLAFGSQDMAALQAGSIAQAEQLLAKERPDLLILDVNLPDGSGFDFCKKIRKTSTVPILFLTANDMELDIVTGLELGGDDYITKPFSLAVLRARVASLLRRSGGGKRQAYQQDGFFFDFDNMEFRKHGREISLSKTEQKLLRLLVENRNATMSRAALVDKIWMDGAEYVDENALSVTIRRLRGKLEDNAAAPQYIHTIYGIGYQWGGKG